MNLVFRKIVFEASLFLLLGFLLLGFFALIESYAVLVAGKSISRGIMISTNVKEILSINLPESELGFLSKKGDQSTMVVFEEINWNVLTNHPSGWNLYTELIFESQDFPKEAFLEEADNLILLDRFSIAEDSLRSKQELNQALVFSGDYQRNFLTKNDSCNVDKKNKLNCLNAGFAFVKNGISKESGENFRIKLIKRDKLLAEQVLDYKTTSQLVISVFCF